MSRPDPMSSVTPCLLVNAYAYSPYGLLGSYETIENAFQYVGRFGVMAESHGLYFMRARYYDPEVGRFINGGARGRCSIWQLKLQILPPNQSQ